MGRIVFFCIPAWGHTNPTLGVVRELVRRGHEVWYYSYDLLRSPIEAAGAHFVSCNAFDAEQRLSPADGARVARDMAFAAKILVDTTLALDETVDRHMEELRPDCIVADSMAVWGKAVALKKGIPVLYSGDEIGQLNEEADHADRNKAEDSRYLHRGKMGWSAATLEPATGPSSASAAAWTGSSWWDCSISAARQGPPLPCTAKGSMRIC